MGHARCCWPPLLGARPQWHRTHGAAHCVCSSPRPALYGPCVPVYPPAPPPHPRSLCHRRQLRLLGFSALHAPSLWFLSYPKPSCTAPERHPILQNLSRERRKQACAAASSLHPPTAYGPPHYYQPTLAYHHSTLSLAAPWPCSLLLPPLFLLPNHPPPRNHQTCGPAGDGTDLTAQTPHVWLAQRSPPPPPSFMLVRAFELRSTAQ